MHLHQLYGKDEFGYRIWDAKKEGDRSIDVIFNEQNDVKG